MKSFALEKFIDERLEENKYLFTKEELEEIKKHKKCFHKVYLLGAINGRDCYKNDVFSD